MDLSQEQLDFITSGVAAAMITVGGDGLAKPVRVGVGLLDGRLCSTATASRRRTVRLRSDPRCTLYFCDPAFKYLAVETTVTIDEGQAGVDGSERLIRAMQGVPQGPVSWFGQTLEPEAFRQRLADEGRVLYRFEVASAHGLLRVP